MSVQWPRTSEALPAALRDLLLDGNLAACMLLPAPITEQNCFSLLFLTSTGNGYTGDHSWLVLLTKDLTSRVRWHSSSLGSSREAPRSGVAPRGRIPCCPWKPSIWWCCRIGPSSWWRESSRNSRIGILTSWWIDRLLSCWLKHKNGMSVCL